MKPSVIVLGAGVSGLTSAIRLCEAGYDVVVWAERMPHDTTSAVAAALCLPYKAYPEDRVLEWTRRSFRVFTELAGRRDSGVQMREGFELWRRRVPDPWWRGVVAEFGRCGAGELPAGFADGYRFQSAVIEMPIYLDYLRRRLEAGGARCEQRRVQSLAEVWAASRVIINCTGLGARPLVPDEQLAPIRGQVVRVANPGLTRFLLDEEDMTYIVPRSRDCILGGTADEGSWDLTPDPATAAAIVARCATLEPRLAGIEVLEHKVGLRPGRPAVRVEREDGAAGAICIHNYGHGGAGVTLSWGCADDVVGLLP